MYLITKPVIFDVGHKFTLMRLKDFKGQGLNPGHGLGITAKDEQCQKSLKKISFQNEPWCSKKSGYDKYLAQKEIRNLNKI